MNMQSKAKHISHSYPAGSWENERVFIIGGGPSLRAMPADQITLLAKEKVIAVNKAFLSFPCQINLALDQSFYKQLYFPRLQKDKVQANDFKYYSGCKAFLDRGEGVNWVKDSNLHIFETLKKQQISYDPNKFYCGNNSGFAAMMLAIALGSKEVYLLGFDLHCQNDQTHWHNGYSGQNVESLNNTLGEFRRCFEKAAPMIKSAGIRVYDACPEGSLHCFPKVKLIKR